MNKGKSDGTNGLFSDHVIFGGSKLFVHISMLLTSMLRHGISPDTLKTSCMVPIPKNSKNNLCSSDNYRAIALISCLTKIMDLIVLKTYGNLLSTCDLQFGFKDGGSTNSCTYVLKETVSYYINNGNNVYAAFLDATKAFDRVNYCKLFYMLIERNIPPCVIRLIMNMYIGQNMVVKWNSNMSNNF